MGNTMTQDSSHSTDALWLQPGTLWTKVQQQTQWALNCGALQHIPTTYEWVEQDDVRFLVRVLASLQRKETATQERDKDFNPFLPYDPNLFVVDLSPTHLVLLNKFNVMDHHILIVTRGFELQAHLLTAADFQALALVLSEMDGLAFYNGGAIAGASQRHKHLQIVPLPFVPDGSRLPLEPLLQEAVSGSGVGSHPQLPYRHAIAPLHDLDFTQPFSLSNPLLERYHHLLSTLALVDSSAAIEPLGAYNLLVTRQWMCVVPRSQESFASIPVNSLGFTGTLLVKNQAQMAQLQQLGPFTVLTKVGYAA
jgi:sulfate adenylyltransferase (ADP) / ATP adenylyltransferase